ncbi:MAG: CHAD domain-containing protein [Candidatus Omnitrophica bacterium]|nr:CHAD domain-containing protein [Candidatus Omnitrophota bacterium]
MNARDLFIKLTEHHARGVEAEVKGVRQNLDIEHLHRMRVSLRRLKSTLSDFKEVVPPRDYEILKGNLKKLLRAMGSARDMDTKIDFLRKLAAEPRAARYREGIFEIIDEIAEDRNEVQPKITRTIAKLHRKKIFHSARRLKVSLEETGITLDEWAKNRILARLEKMFGLEPYVRKPGCVTELHEMRIAAKNLRYTLENLEHLYGQRRIRPYSQSAMKVQRALGDVHNFDVWLNLMKILSDSSGREPSFRRAVTFLRQECAVRRVTSYKAFVKLWASLKRRKVWANLSFFALDRQ